MCRLEKALWILKSVFGDFQKSTDWLLLACFIVRYWSSWIYETSWRAVCSDSRWAWGEDGAGAVIYLGACGGPEGRRAFGWLVAVGFLPGIQFWEEALNPAHGLPALPSTAWRSVWDLSANAGWRTKQLRHGSVPWLSSSLHVTP